MSSTFSNCRVLFSYLHSFAHASFNYHTASSFVSSISYTGSLLCRAGYTLGSATDF